MSANPAPETDFGFRRVPAAAKAGLVRQVFASVAPRYDLMNDLMSLGVHRVWKHVLLTALDPAAEPHPARSRRRHRGYQLRLARGVAAGRWCCRTSTRRCWRWRGTGRRIAGWSAGLDLLVADAEHLPLPDRRSTASRSPSACATAPTRTRCCARRAACSAPAGGSSAWSSRRLQVAAFAPVYDAWSFQVLPALGARVAGDAESLPVPRRKHPHLPRPGHAWPA